MWIWKNYHGEQDNPVIPVHVLLLEAMHRESGDNEEASNEGGDDGGEAEMPSGAIEVLASSENVVHFFN